MGLSLTHEQPEQQLAAEVMTDQRLASTLSRASPFALEVSMIMSSCVYLLCHAP